MRKGGVYSEIQSDSNEQRRCVSSGNGKMKNKQGLGEDTVVRHHILDILPSSQDKNVGEGLQLFF